MSENPARIVGLPDQGRPLEVGEPANLTVVDPDATWTVAGSDLASRSDNTPYESMTLPARSHIDAIAWQGHRPRRKIPGMNTGTLVGSLIVAAVLAVAIGLAVQAIVRGWRHRAERQAELIGTLPPMTGHRRTRPRACDEGPLRRQHAGAQLAGPHRGRGPRLPHQGRA